MKSIWLAFYLLFVGQLMAQDYTHVLDGITKVVITAEASIVIKAHAEDYLLMQEAENSQRKVPAAAKGLTSLTDKGQDNTNYGVAVQQSGSVLHLTGLRNRLAADLVVRLPSTINLSLEVLNNNDIHVSGIQSEIEAINKNGEIILRDITGPVVTENRNGNTRILFTTLSQASPSSCVASNGDIDISLPTETPVTISFKSPRGDFYTDFAIQLPQKIKSDDHQRTLVGTINEGGVSLNLYSAGGDIFLRKRE